MSITAKAIWYVESHLSGDTSLETVADSVGVSHFHLARAFATTTGEGLAAYARARKLSVAAAALAAGAPDILTLAMDAGYGSHEAFTRAFRQHFGVTPEKVRADATIDHLPIKEPYKMQQAETQKIAPPRIEQRGELLIFGLNRRQSVANNNEIPAQWMEFVPYLGHIEGQVGPETYGVCYNFDGASLEYLCGVEVKEFPTHPETFSRLRIPPQTYAVFRHTGHISSIKGTWQAIFEEGLPSTGRKSGDGPSFERYGKEFDGRTGLGGLEIWIPVS